MKMKRRILVAALALTVVAGGAGAAWYYTQRPGGKPAPVQPEAVDYKYVSLEKVIVMLRDGSGSSVPHYLAMDLVFKTSGKQEKITKEHLPLLRSVALKALADYPVEKANRMSIDQFAVALNQAFTAAYARDHAEKPFAEAMIGKLIIE
ncbi:flagellar basal body protein [Jeongeupia naejangsanensis]|uniref:Flagellar basal body protein n=1 Tax=Jeongeupia naejangsanensis TaxID=613195 RepID=A0ABS2BGG2_9NEIS|nr:flagellar basal body protein [Jeongeupia naejangsanensis]MBM3114712.1 flagellar basal body protein [Jeongeupia naejangsanensis]